MIVVEKPSLEERALRKAKIEAGCELYFKMAEGTGRLPNNCWSKIMEDLGSPQWMKRYHLYNEIKRKRLQQPPSQTKTPIAPGVKNKSVVTKSNDDVSEASTLDELIKIVISTDNKDDVSELTGTGGPEDRPLFFTKEKPGCAKADLKILKKKLYSSPSTPKTMTTRKVKRAKVSD